MNILSAWYVNESKAPQGRRIFESWCHRGDNMQTERKNKFGTRRGNLLSSVVRDDRKRGRAGVIVLL